MRLKGDDHTVEAIVMQYGRTVFGLAAAGLVTALALAVPAPAAAQSTGLVKGKVVDGQQQVVEGATVILETKDGGNRRFKVSTNKKGEYIQIGLAPGVWNITASKDGVGQGTATVKISLGSQEQVDLTLGKAPATKEETAKQDAMSKAFNEGVAFTQAGKLDEAIAKFTEAKSANPDCYACQFNIGLAYAGKKDVAKAEEAFLAAGALKPDSPEPYNQLAQLYNASRQFDKAAQAATEAAKRSGGATGGATPEALFNQGIVMWNANKYPEAKTAFEGAIKAKPDYAEAHYRLGMASLNTGDMAGARTAFENYIKYAPTGEHAAEVKTFLTQLPK
jgi:tetratricopeptide (TPR) repeat protein